MKELIIELIVENLDSQNEEKLQKIFQILSNENIDL